MDQPRSYLRWCADPSPCSFCTRKLTLMLMSFSVMSVTLLWAILAAFAGTIPCKTKHRTAQKTKKPTCRTCRFSCGGPPPLYISLHASHTAPGVAGADGSEDGSDRYTLRCGSAKPSQQSTCQPMHPSGWSSGCQILMPQNSTGKNVIFKARMFVKYLRTATEHENDQRLAAKYASPLTH